MQYKPSNTTKVERSNTPIGGISFRAGLIKGSVRERKIGVKGLLWPCICGATQLITTSIIIANIKIFTT